MRTIKVHEVYCTFIKKHRKINNREKTFRTVVAIVPIKTTDYINFSNPCEQFTHLPSVQSRQRDAYGRKCTLPILEQAYQLNKPPKMPDSVAIAVLNSMIAT